MCYVLINNLKYFIRLDNRHVQRFYYSSEILWESLQYILVMLPAVCCHIEDPQIGITLLSFKGNHGWPLVQDIGTTKYGLLVQLCDELTMCFYLICLVHYDVNVFWAKHMLCFLYSFIRTYILCSLHETDFGCYVFTSIIFF